MQRRQLTLTLTDNLVLSQSSATTGEHECLSYIPGAALLGLAARDYSNFSAEEQWLVFHSGKVRFGDARLRGPAGCESVPMPLALHSVKGETKTRDDTKSGRKWISHEHVYNLALMPRSRLLDQGLQPKQMRDAFLTAQGELLKPALEGSLKTAIDPQLGRAQDGQLFGYQSLKRGQTFCGSLDADSDVPAALLERVCTLLQEKPRLGRSRSAQFGRVQVAIEKPVAVPKPVAQGNKLVLLALSDLALCDFQGQPLLTPTAQALGLEQVQLNEAGTHLRTRRYSPYNQWRNSYDSERQVILAGSVITFDKQPGFDERCLESLLAGVGAYREAGLGQLWVNPAFLMAETLAATDPLPELKTTSAAKADESSSPLIQWLKSQKKVDPTEISATVRELVGELKTLYRTARSYLGAVVGAPVGPGNSQWGRVMDAAKKPGAKKQVLLVALFDSGGGKKQGSHICKGADWDTLGFIGNDSQTFAVWLKNKLNGVKEDIFVDVVAQLAREAQSTAITRTRLGQLEH